MTERLGTAQQSVFLILKFPVDLFYRFQFSAEIRHLVIYFLKFINYYYFKICQVSNLMAVSCVGLFLLPIVSLFDSYLHSFGLISWCAW